jgi:hypothetical protein
VHLPTSSQSPHSYPTLCAAPVVPFLTPNKRMITEPAGKVTWSSGILLSPAQFPPRILLEKVGLLGACSK